MIKHSGRLLYLGRLLLYFEHESIIFDNIDPKTQHIQKQQQQESTNMRKLSITMVSITWKAPQCIWFYEHRNIIVNEKAMPGKGISLCHTLGKASMIMTKTDL